MPRPLQLKPPDDRHATWWVRGTLPSGERFQRTTGETERSEAAKWLRKWQREVNSGELAPRARLSFGSAALAYEKAGGDQRFIKPILDYFGKATAAEDIDQAAIDAAAVAILPSGKPATRNRQVYTPIAAILRHNGFRLDLRRPRGAQGQRRTAWLRPEQFEAVATAAERIDRELGVLMVTLVYTGMRLSEALHLPWSAMNLGASTAILATTKNGDPRTVHLPPRVVAALATMPARPRVFRWTKNGKLNGLARAAYIAAGVPCGSAPFHILRHTWATWMVGGGADLVATGAWRSQAAARGYTHFVASEEARKADALPGANGVLLVSNPQAVEK